MSDFRKHWNTAELQPCYLYHQLYFYIVQFWWGCPTGQRDHQPANPGASEPSGDLSQGGAKSQGGQNSISCIAFDVKFLLWLLGTVHAVCVWSYRALSSIPTGSTPCSWGGYAARRSRIFPDRSPRWHCPHPDAHPLNLADSSPKSRPQGHRLPFFEKACGAPIYNKCDESLLFAVLWVKCNLTYTTVKKYGVSMVLFWGGLYSARMH